MPATDAELRRTLLREPALRQAATPPLITPICEEQDGWLVRVALPANATGASAPSWAHDADGAVPTVWRVQRTNAQQLDGWLPGPTYDFDGDGTPEASTSTDNELKIWFDRGTKPSYAIVGFIDPQRPRLPWAALDHEVVWLEGDPGDMHALAFRPGQGPRELPRDACEKAAGPSAGCSESPRHVGRDLPRADKLSPEIEAVLSRRASAARCVQPDDAARARHEAVIEQAMLRELDQQSQRGAAFPLAFSWGCTSHGETPVVVELDEQDSATGSALWSVRGDNATRRGTYWSPTPDEWTSSHWYELGHHGDFDGDGLDESIIEQHFGHPGEYARITVNLGGRERVIPSNLVLRAADGKRDGLVRLRPFAVPAPVPAPCEPVSPDACLPGPPPVGWLPANPGGSWDWAHQTPQVLVWRGSRFVPLGDAAVAAVTAETAAARAMMK